MYGTHTCTCGPLNLYLSITVMCTAVLYCRVHLWLVLGDCSFPLSLSLPIAGKVVPIEEGHICVVEIPKGSNDLGLIVSQCERTVGGCGYHCHVNTMYVRTYYMYS